MHEWLAEYAETNRVLDIGSASGSFSTAGLSCSIISLDEDTGAFAGSASLGGKRRCVVGRAEQLPIASGSIDLVVCNHALEHVAGYPRCLDEIRRILKPDGRLFVSVPNGYGLCDSLYRWMFEGGGHVNRFRRDELVGLVQSHVGLRLARWQKLYSSFAYLHTVLDLLASRPEGLQNRLRRLAWLPPQLVKIAHWLIYGGTRFADRLMGTRSAIYGWAFWFDHGAGFAIENEAYINVCMYCGTGHPSGTVGRVSWRRWICASCHRRNPFWFSSG